MKFLTSGLILVFLAASFNLQARSSDYLSPTALAITRDGKLMFVACGTANRVLLVDTGDKKVHGHIIMPASPSGLILSLDNKTLYVTCAGPESRICIVDTANRRITGTIPAGHTALSPVLSPDGKTLYVCNQFDNDVSVIDLTVGRETQRISVPREPIAADVTRDGKYLLVANHLSLGPSDLKNVAAVVSVIDLSAGREVNELALPVGSEMLKDLRVSPDGSYAVVTHIFCNYDLPTRNIELGLINANAMTIINLRNIQVQCTFLLDTPDHGAGNPWCVDFSADGATLVVAHAGTHEVSVINFPELLAGLPDVNRKAAWPTNLSTSVLKFVPHYQDEELNDGLPFLVGARKRIKLPPGDLSPRAVLLSGHTVYTANYFSDNLSAIDLTTTQSPVTSISLGTPKKMTAARLGEFYFHDADICFQGWQSCSSCHPGGGRVDALNWDLASEGPGHPKNTKSILLADQTEPLALPKSGSMAMDGTVKSAVRVAMRTLLFTNLPEAVAADMDEYIKTLKPVPSPYLLHGDLSAEAKRGQVVFSDAGCVRCHVPGLYTDRLLHNVGTVTRYDTSPQFPTPSLREAWRTAPYLHNGSAATIRDVLTTRNPNDGRHGDVADLSSHQIDDLCAYVLSL
jgi:YVTN family beta-propeller protein